MVGIARALVVRPSIILADEPTGNLQSTQALQIMDLFKKLNEEEGITIVQVTHSGVNAAYGNRTLHLLDGVVDKEQFKKGC
ncbi:ABC transporter ATP-binding protein YtrE [compost metagenome]